MKKTRQIVTILLCLMALNNTLSAQPLCSVVRYDEADGVPSSHVTQLLQDDLGMMWFSTWNGLCRYDGYAFRTFKPQVGDGCHMATDRIRSIDLLESRNILCQADDGYYMFDMKQLRFRDLTKEEQRRVGEWEGKRRPSRSLQRKPYTWTDRHQTQWTLRGDGQLSYLDRQTGAQVGYALPMNFRTLTFAMADKTGNLWALDYGSIYKFTTDVQRAHRLPIEPCAEVKCLFSDREGRYWVATKDDGAVRVYSHADNRLLGYLGADGRVHQNYTRFGAAVYCMYQQQDGTLWLGTKPQGLFRLRPKAADLYEVTNITALPNTAVYHINEDRWGRLWVATLGGGIGYTDQPQAESPVFSVPKQYPKDASRARYLFINRDNVLLVATNGGLVVSRLEREADQMTFRLHQRQADDKESMSCSAAMDVVQDSKGRYFVSTESGGVNEIMTHDLLADHLVFRHVSEQFHVRTNDVVQSLATMPGGGLMAVGSHLITLLDSTLQGRMLDAADLYHDYRFSEAHPLALKNGKWIFGLTDGAFVTTTSDLVRKAYSPRVVLTDLTYQDTLTLHPHERSVTIHFAAIDYQAPERISYAFRLQNGDENYIGQNRSVTLLDLEPGTYQLQIRSTNSDGEWLDNQRTLTIIVKPTFWESAIGRLLLFLLVAGVLAAIVYTWLYIRRIKRQQHETLEKYLALISEPTPFPSQREESTNVQVQGNDIPTSLRGGVGEESDPMLQRVMQFVEENLSNSEVSVGDMASAAATSRSGLQRKLKQTMGITPQDLMKEARIKRACQLLRESDKNISEVAYACGFTDPKYFSRSFKQSTGVTPTEYRER